jgi:hypothetical protein
MFIVHSNEGMRSFNLKTQCSKPKFRHVDQAGLSKIAHSVGLYFTHGKCRLPGTPGHVSVIGGGASSTRIEAPSQSAQDPHHLGWTPLSVLTSLGAKRTRHVFDHFYRRHMPEVPQTSKALRYRGTSDEPSPCNPQLPMHRLRSCISQNHLTEAGRAVVSTDGNLKVQ